MKSLLFGLSLLGSTFTATAQDVDIFLVLLQDVSGSISGADFSLQRDGYANAFRSSAIASAFNSNFTVATTFVYWSDFSQVAVPVTILDSAADSIAFGDAIAATTRPGTGTSTAPGTALFETQMRINDALNGGLNPAKVIVDISSDGVRNKGGEPAPVRDFLLNTNTDVINALVIEDMPNFTTAQLIDYYTDNVIGGPGAFVFGADSFSEFEVAIAQKIRTELGIIPEPSTIALIGVGGLLALFVLRRRARRA